MDDIGFLHANFHYHYYRTYECQLKRQATVEDLV